MAMYAVYPERFDDLSWRFSNCCLLYTSEAETVGDSDPDYSIT